MGPTVRTDVASAGTLVIPGGVIPTRIAARLFACRVHPAHLQIRLRRPTVASMSDKLTPDQIERLRAAATTRVKVTSLRKAAREIGMSPSGLQKFLNGTAPYEPTLHRLRTWYGDDGAQREREEAIARLLGLLPAQRRTKAEAVLRAMLTGPVSKRQPLDAALADLDAPEDRARIARGLSRLAKRRRDAPRPSNLLNEAVAILSALVELLDAELPRDARLIVNGRRVRRDSVLHALQRYVDSSRGE